MTKENADISRFSKILQPGVKVYKCQKKYHYQKLTFIVLFWFLIKNRFIQKKKNQMPEGMFPYILGISVINLTTKLKDYICLKVKLGYSCKNRTKTL